MVTLINMSYHHCMAFCMLLSGLFDEIVRFIIFFAIVKLLQ